MLLIILVLNINLLIFSIKEIPQLFLVNVYYSKYLCELVIVFFMTIISIISIYYFINIVSPRNFAYPTLPLDMNIFINKLKEYYSSITNSQAQKNENIDSEFDKLLIENYTGMVEINNKRNDEDAEILNKIDKIIIFSLSLYITYIVIYFINRKLLL
ncbi:MAG: hypothetical protein NT009_12990 [Proteobacteria bacterium]|nr:hypothetical protein [Pseudomonadota bacterium]